MSNITKWSLYFFAGLVILLNAVETAMFGATYLPAAFGNPDNFITSILAAMYVLLMLDVAYLVWFKVWLSGEQATAQRDVALVLSVVALLGSIMATVTQLATNTDLAPYLEPYRDTIGTISFFVLLGVTVAHIVGLAVYQYYHPTQQVQTATALIQGRALQSALAELEKRANEDKHVLVDIMAAEMRIDLLHALGFTGEVTRIGNGVIIDQEMGDEVEAETAVSHEPNPQPVSDEMNVDEGASTGRYSIYLSDGRSPYPRQDNIRTATALATGLAETTEFPVQIYDHETGKMTTIEPNASDPKAVAMATSPNGSGG